MIAGQHLGLDESCGHEFPFNAIVHFPPAVFNSKDAGIELAKNWIMVLPRE